MVPSHGAQFVQSTPSHTDTGRRRATSHSHKRLQKQPPIHVPQVPQFQNNKIEIEGKITKQQRQPKKAKH